MFKLSIARQRTGLIVATIATAVVLVVMSSCGAAPHPTTGSGNFATVVYVGDSLTAGFQNGSLLDSQQPNGYASLIGAQAGYSVTLPLIAPPGAPAVLQLVSLGPPPVIQQASGTTTGRDNPDQQPTDLAVPGHLLHDLLYTGPVAVPTTDEEIITDLVLAFPLGNTNTQAQEAIALKPTFLFVWIGNNDALVADETGMPSSMTPIADFTTDFTTLMQGVHGETGATLVVANIPDVTLVPYLTPATTVIAEAATQTGLTTAQISTILGITDGDLVNATGLAEVQTDLQNIAANKATTPLDDAGFLSAAEVVQVQSQIAAYNAVIAQQVASANGILVDLNSTFTSLKSGVTINGYTATTGFLGGIFSLDGIHPTNTGYAIIANKFIDAINSRLTNAIPDVDLSTIAAADPLFPPNIKPTGGAAKLKHIPLNVAKQTDKFIRPHAH